MKPSRQASPLLKRRSSEPYHLRNKPSSVTHRDVLPAISTRVSRPIYGRKNLFYVILVILLCSYTQFKLLGPTRSHQLPAVQTGTPATQIVASLYTPDSMLPHLPIWCTSSQNISYLYRVTNFHLVKPDSHCIIRPTKYSYCEARYNIRTIPGDMLYLQNIVRSGLCRI